MIMKKFLFILTVIAGLFVSNAEARMKIRIPVDNSIPKVAALPDSSYYKTDEGAHLDLGYIEEDGKRTLVLFSESKPDTYYEISDEYAEVIKKRLECGRTEHPYPHSYILGQMGWQYSFLWICRFSGHRHNKLSERFHFRPFRTRKEK